MGGYVERTIVSVAEILRGDLYRTAYVHHLECGHEFEREVKMEGTLLCPTCREPSKHVALPPMLAVDCPNFSPPSVRWQGWKWTYVPGCVAADFVGGREREPLDCWLGLHDENPPCFMVIWMEAADRPGAKGTNWSCCSVGSVSAAKARDKAVAAGVLS